MNTKTTNNSPFISATLLQNEDDGTFFVNLYFNDSDITRRQTIADGMPEAEGVALASALERAAQYLLLPT